MISPRENYLRAARFRGPAYIPVSVTVTSEALAQMGPDAEAVFARHPRTFPDYRPGRIDFDHLPYVVPPGGELVDPWGCLWRSPGAGGAPLPVGHPLADWSALADFVPPPVQPQRPQALTGTWEELAERLDRARRGGRVTSVALPHGFFLLRLTYLRGFENLMYDFADDPPQLGRLLAMLEHHAAGMVERFLAMDPDVVGFPEDLGAQQGPLVSPGLFERWLLPVYRRLMARVRRAGKLVHMHSDGCILELLDGMASAGVDILNVQDLVNGLDALARQAKGRFCIELDIDRQSVVPFGTPADIRDLVAEGVRKLYDPAGGLMLRAGIYPPTSAKNLHALCEAFETYQTYTRP